MVELDRERLGEVFRQTSNVPLSLFTDHAGSSAMQPLPNKKADDPARRCFLIVGACVRYRRRAAEESKFFISPIIEGILCNARHSLPRV
jgi:hypothetical protein